MYTKEKNFSNKIIEIETPSYLLRTLTQEDASEHYLSWLKDREVNKFLTSNIEDPTVNYAKVYIEHVNKLKNSILLGIFTKNSGQHIGNVSITSISWRNYTAFIGIMIGEKSFWGKGVATEVIKRVKEYAFEELGLYKVGAGCCSINYGSWKAFKKAGFKRECIMKKVILIDNIYYDNYLMVAFNKNFKLPK